MHISRILLGLVLIVGATGALATGTSAFFSDTETSSGNTFTAGEIDLLVDNESYATNIEGDFVFNGSLSWEPSNLNDGDDALHRFFVFDDVKPGDRGEDTISLHVQNDAYACMDVSLMANAENGVNEAEAGVDDASDGTWDGELAQALEMFWWADDGDNVYEEGESAISDGVETLFNLATTSPFSVALADSDGSIWPDDGPIPAGEPRYIGKMWCFGTLTEAPVAQDGIGDTGTPGQGDSTNGPLQRGTGFTCDGAVLGNETQTDSAELDVAFRAIQARNNPGFQCAPDEPDEPEIGQCSAGEEFADAGTFDQGTQKGGASVLANRSVLSAAFGAPQTSGAASDVGFPAGSFFSLGFKGAGPEHGVVTLEFDDNVIVPGAGADLKIYEVTGGAYPDEKVKVEVSQDGSTWHVVSASATRDAEIDIESAGIPYARFVRLTDISNVALFANDADGYDLDAVEALHCGVLEEETEIPTSN